VEAALSKTKIAIIGGCGHVGLPLGVKFALAGAQTVLVDVDKEAVGTVCSGRFPFLEQDGDAQLRAALAKGLRATVQPDEAAGADVTVFVTGTPVDEHLNPKLSTLLHVIDEYQDLLRPGTLVVMRSTLFPGTMEHLYHRFRRSQVDVKLAFCPERVSQGLALREIDSLPQIVSAFEEDAYQVAGALFAHLAPSIVRLTPLEAEITKLMANSWRYLEFAIANQFYMIAEEKGVDFHKIYKAVTYDYPRARGYKRPGLAAGPCLFNDTMQLASYFDHRFYLGHSAMLVNEGLATFIVEKTCQQTGGSLWGRTIGLLGMAFKANSDDTRESLAFKVKRGLEFAGARVVFHDPYLPDSTPLAEVLSSSDVLVITTPHDDYAGLRAEAPVIDVWGFLGTPELEILPGRTRG
jgi:UDP-N-acetyl-D-mannosaminuronic acid dehydrogenase